jgi:hypothetical protein
MKLFRAYLKQLGSARVRVDHVNRLPVPKSSGHRDSAVIVAVPFIRMMHVAFDDVVGMTAVRYRLMSTTSPMIVLTVVRTASMSRRTSGRIRATLRQGMFIHMPLVSAVKMPLMQIVDMTFVFHRGVPAARTVGMGMLVVRFVVAHFIVSFRLLAFGSNGVIPTDCEFIIANSSSVA